MSEPQSLPEPATIALPEYQCEAFIVTGFTRQRNPPGRPYLTLAIGTWTRTGFATRHSVGDIVTRMRLADALSHLHTLPVNETKLYGPRGRRCDVGRA